MGPTLVRRNSPARAPAYLSAVRGTPAALPVSAPEREQKGTISTERLLPPAVSNLAQSACRHEVLLPNRIGQECPGWLGWPHLTHSTKLHRYDAARASQLIASLSAHMSSVVCEHQLSLTYSAGL